MTWTHRICADCYIDKAVTESEFVEPTRVVPDATPAQERCCFCSNFIVNVGKHGGIYVRHDPALLDCEHN